MGFMDFIFGSGPGQVDWAPGSSGINPYAFTPGYGGQQLQSAMMQQLEGGQGVMQGGQWVGGSPAFRQMREDTERAKKAATAMNVGRTDVSAGTARRQMGEQKGAAAGQAAMQQGMLKAQQQQMAEEQMRQWLAQQMQAQMMREQMQGQYQNQANQLMMQRELANAQAQQQQGMFGALANTAAATLPYVI